MAPVSFAGTGIYEGEALLGKYKVERMLGRGGMGFVVAARHLGLDQTVAIKMLLPSSLTKPELVSRFAREAKAAAKLRNEHVVRVMDVGELADGAPYLVMEYLRGRDLSEVLAERGRLPITESVDCVLQSLEAIAEAHARGLVHRDLKPSNLFLADRGGGAAIVKLLDFGISKHPDDAGSAELSLTGKDAVIGSPRYMSPEQLRSAKTCDARTDIWAMGVILYELITGRFPFDADSASALVAQITADPPLQFTADESVPRELARAIMLCLDKDRGRRPETALELAKRLEPFGGPLAAQRLEAIARMSQVATCADEVPAAPRRAGSMTDSLGVTAPPLVKRTALVERRESQLSELADSLQMTQGPLARAKPRSGRLPWALAIALLIAIGLIANAIRAPEPLAPAEEKSSRTTAQEPPPAIAIEPPKSALTSSAADRARAPARAHPARTSPPRARDPLNVRPY
jgi:serine/threonine-protein kinase